MSTPKYTQSLPGLPRATNPKTPTKPKRLETFSTPKVLKGNAFAIASSLLRQQFLPGKKKKNIQPIERIKQPLEKIKPGLNKEMKYAILLDVPGLIEKRLPDTLFQRLACLQPLIIVVDGSELLPHADSDRDASMPVTDDGQDHPCTADVQDAPNSSTLPEQQHQANEGIVTVEADDNRHPQNGGDGEEPAAVDTHAATVSYNSPNIAPHPLINLSRPSTPSASVPSTESIAPFPGVKEIFKHLSDKESEPLYDDVEKKWIDWPETSAQRKENEIAGYLNKVLERVRSFLYGTSDGDDDWIFSSLYADKPIMDEGVCRKPDLVLVRRKDSEGFEWEDIRAVAEIKTNARSLKQIGIDSAKYIREMFGANKARRFALLFSLVDTKMALFKYDRSGALVSKEFDVHEDPEQFLRVIVGMAFGEDYYLGLDPSFLNKDGKTYVTFKGKLYEFIRVIHLDPVIRSRGTVVILVKDPDTGKLLVIKDQWVDRDRRLKEADILSKLAGKSLKVNRLVGHMVIAFKIGDADNLLDSTEADREGVEDRKKSAIEIRDHYRLLLSPFGDNITKFRSLRELVSAFRDYAETIRDLYKAGYYHRDISDKNLIIVSDNDNSPTETDGLPAKIDGSPTQTDSLSAENDEPPTKTDNTHRVGYLIDLDCATEVVHMRGATAELTGTLPFMPIEMLENYGCEHKYYFDLESLFYVLVWICLTEDGPRREGHIPQSRYDFKGSVLGQWCGGDSVPNQDDNVAFKNIGVNKRGVMGDVMVFRRDILNHLPKYFEHVKTLLKDLRKVLFRPALDDEDDTNTPEDERPISERQDVDRVFRRYIEALEKVRDGLPASDLELPPIGDINGQSNHVDTNDHSVPLAVEDKPGKRVRRAFTAKRPTLVEDANDDDDSSVESEPDDKRKDPDYIGPGYISPTAGKGRQSRTIGSLLSTKRPGPDLGSLTKRRRTTSARAKASRS
ncbi:hypothetical protein ACEPAI_3026 [Sanghuangporus weigelae]